MTTSTEKSLLFVVTEDWYFWSHRLALARAARNAGWHVTVATRVQAHPDWPRFFAVDRVWLSKPRHGEQDRKC